MIRYIENGLIAVAHGRIGSINDALDMMATAYYGGAYGIIIYKDSLPDGFFKLKTGIAGEILQKFSNYGMKLAIVGDFKNFQSSSLTAFIRECNRGRHVFFKESEQEAVSALCDK